MKLTLPQSLRKAVLLALASCAISTSSALDQLIGGEVINVNDRIKATAFYERGWYGASATAANVDSFCFNSAYPWLNLTLNDEDETVLRFPDDSYIYKGIGASGGDLALLVLQASIVGGFTPDGSSTSMGIAPMVTLKSAAMATNYDEVSGEFDLAAAAMFSSYRNYFTTNQVDVVYSNWWELAETGVDHPSLMIDAFVAMNKTTSFFTPVGSEGGGINSPAMAYNGFCVGWSEAYIAEGEAPVTTNSGPGSFYDPYTGKTISGVVAAVDIVAPGTDLLFIDPDGQTDPYYATRSSLASSVVAGGVALYHDAVNELMIEDSRYESAKDAIVTKAILLNSASKEEGWTNNASMNAEGVYFTSQGLDYQVGAGTLNLEGTLNTLLFENNSGWASDSFAPTPEQNYFAYDLGEILANKQVTLTLTWNVERSMDSSLMNGTDADFIAAYGESGQNFTYADLNLQDYFFADLSLELWKVGENNELLTLVAASDTKYNNVEHLTFTIEEGASYTTVIRYLGNAYESDVISLTGTDFAYAWSVLNSNSTSNGTLTNLYEDGKSSIKSAYQLAEVTADNPASNFSITKFKELNGTLKAVDFNVVFNEMIGSGEPSSYYKWQVVDGNLTLVAGTAGDYDIVTGAEGVITTRQAIASGTELSFDSSFVGIIRSAAYGGAIYSNATITSITGHFIGNYATNSNSFTRGGAICNYGTINKLAGDFVGNYATNSGGSSFGGGIYNTGTIDSITGDFIGNYTSSSSSTSSGAIENVGTINSITGNFIGNYATSSNSGAQGGAIYNTATIGSITGDFVGNYASGSTAQGGAIYNQRAISIREGSSFTGNYVSTDGGVTKNFEAIYNLSAALGSSAIINFNAYDSSKSIIVNDGISGAAGYKRFQRLEINNTADDVSYGTVEFNSFVNNQTVNVRNGNLKLGSFEGATLNVNGTALEVAATSASLTNTDINVKDGSTLLIAANVSMDSNSNINLDTGASLNFDEGSSLAAASYSISTPAEDETELAMLATVNEAPASTISGNNATLSADKIENATISNLALSASADMELKNSTLSNGSTLQASGESTVSLNNVALTTGARLGDAVATSLANGLTMTGTLDASELNITSLTFSLASLGENEKKEGQYVLFTTGGTTQLKIEEAANITSTVNFDYAWGLNEGGDIILASTLTTIVVSGVSYDADLGWTLAVSEDQYELLDLNKSSFSGNFLFSAEALADFELVKEANSELEWMESYTVSYGNADDTLSINDLANAADITMNTVLRGENGYLVAYIPEPSTVTLSLLALAGLAARRRRKVA